MSKIGFKTSRKSVEDYFKWRIERATPAVEKVNALRNLKDLQVLDIGCGYGSLMSVLLDHEAHVTGVEVDEKKLAVASKMFKDNKEAKVVQVTDEQLPFEDASFDIVFLFDVIEHVKDPKRTIEECQRVLKPNGILYVEFTPYYSITGHHLYDFSKLPIHILPPHKIKQMIYSKKVESFSTPEDYWDLFNSLNKLRISRFQSFVKNFKKIEERFIIKYPDVFEINLPFVDYLGPFKDYFTLSFEGIYQKSS